MKTLLVMLACGTALLGAAVRGDAPAVTPLGMYLTSLSAPARLAADVVGNLYVVDPLAGNVIVFDAFGRVRASRSGLGRPLGIAVDSQGRIFLGAEKSGSISVYDAQWNLLYKLGAGDGEFGLPNYIAIDPASNTVFVADSAANEIKVYSGTALVNRFGSFGSLNGQFDFPAGVGVSAGGEVWVVDQNNDRVQVFDRSGVYLRQINFRSGMFSDRTGRRQGLVLDKAGHFFVADSFQGTVTAYDTATGAAYGSVGSFGVLAGEFNLPAATAIDPYNRLYVASTGNGRVEMFGLDKYIHLTMEPPTPVVAAGTAIVFTAIAGGQGPFTFQWLRNSVPLSDGGSIGGATNGVLTITGAGTTDGGAYSVIVTGPAGTITSSLAQVTVQIPPAILAGPAGATVLRGARVEFSVAASGDNPGYQWKHEGLELPGETNSTLVLTEAQTFNAGLYKVIVKNDAGSVVSPPALLTVLVPPQIMEFLGIAMLPEAPSVLTLNSDPGASYELDVTTNFTDWVLCSTFTNDTGTMDLTDPDSTNAVKRYYRFRWLPPSPAP